MPTKNVALVQLDATLPGDPLEQDISFFRSHWMQRDFVRRLTDAERASGRVPPGCVRVCVSRVGNHNSAVHLREFLLPSLRPRGAVRTFGVTNLPITPNA